MDAFYREALTNERELRMLSVYCSDVVVSENDVNAFYMDNYVNPDRERYENDIALYESEIVAKNNEAFFVPEGYRYIKQILLPLPDAVKEELKPYSRRA